MLQKQKIVSEFTILNDKGLHTRPATEIIKCTSNYHCRVTLRYQGLCVDGKSLLGVLMLAAPKGAKIEITVEGDDAQACIEEVLALAHAKFYMNY